MLQVLHNHLPPNDTLFLDSTSRPYPTRLNLWGPTVVWDGISSQALLSHAAREGLVTQDVKNLAWSHITAIIWVIDAQDDYLHSLASLHSTILLAYSHNPAIAFHVFLHKMDGLSEDYRDDTQADVEKRIEDDLSDASSAFQFARGVDIKSIMNRMDEEQEEDNRGARLPWTELEKKSAASAAHDVSGDTTPVAGGVGASSSSFSSRQAHVPMTRRRRQSSVRSGRGEANTAGVSLESDVRLSLHQTSIFDSSMFVAFSRVLQDLALQSPGGVLKHALARLVDNLVDSCAIANSHTDGQGRPPQTHSEDRAGTTSVGHGDEAIASTTTIARPSTSSPPPASLVFEKLYLMHLPTRTYLCSDSSPFDKSSFDVVCDYLAFLVSMSGLFANLKSTDNEDTSADERRQYPASTLRLHSSSAGGGGLGGGSGPGFSATSGAEGSLSASAVGSLGGPGAGGSGSTGAAGLGTNSNAASHGTFGQAGASNTGPTEDETLLSFWQLDDGLAVVAILRYEVSSSSGAESANVSRGVEAAASQQGDQPEETTSGGAEGAESAVDRNIVVFRKALKALLAVSRGQKDVKTARKELMTTTTPQQQQPSSTVSSPSSLPSPPPPPVSEAGKGNAIVETAAA